jgi:hypothetical protein
LGAVAADPARVGRFGGKLPPTGRLADLARRQLCPVLSMSAPMTDNAARLPLPRGPLWLALGWLLAPAAFAQSHVPGQTYFGRSNYIEYLAGDLPVIVAAPHGGSLKPAELPDRTYGTTNTDANTEPLTREILEAFTNRFGAFPHVIICRLHREKIDCNREIVEGAQGHPLTETAWHEFQDFIVAAKRTVTNHFGRGLFLDIHGHGHALQRLELGYLMDPTELDLSDATLNAGNYGAGTSIRHLDVISAATFAQLLRGTNSLGSLLGALGHPAVPSAAIPSPGTNAYFNGGYNTAGHGSRFGGTVSSIQIECNFTNVRDSALNRGIFATNLARAVATYFSNHFALNLHDRLPTISAITNRTINEDTTTSAIAFTVADDVTPAAGLVLTRATSDTTLAPVSRISLGGSGANRTVTVNPATNQSGAATITVSAGDANGGTNWRSFLLTVLPVNDPPVLAPLVNRTNGAGAVLTLTNLATDVDNDALMFSLLSSPANAAIDPGTGILTWRPAVAQAGSNHTVRIKVTDNGTNTLSATQSFNVLVPPLAGPGVATFTLTNGHSRLAITGDAGPDYTVQASTNLADWLPVFVTNSPAVPFQWTDTNAAGFIRRFYRILLGP